MAFETPTRIIFAPDNDNTLRPEGSVDDPMLFELVDVLNQADIGPDNTLDTGVATGRSAADFDQLTADDLAFAAFVNQSTFRITSVGTQIDLRDPTTGLWVPAHGYPETIGWDREAAARFFARFGNLTLQPIVAQGPHKLSYFEHPPIPPEEEPAYQETMQEMADRVGLVGHVVVSMGQFFDFLPLGPEGPVAKATAVRALSRLSLEQAAIVDPTMLHSQTFVVAAGDSNNDLDSLVAADAAIVPGNASQTFKDRVRAAWSGKNPDNLFVAERTEYAESLIEGLERLGIIS